MNKEEHEKFHFDQELTVEEVISAAAKIYLLQTKSGVPDDEAMKHASFMNRALNLASWRRYGDCPEKGCIVTDNAKQIEK